MDTIAQTLSTGPSELWAALYLKELEIATDSATTLSQIRKALLSPMDLRYHKHRALAGHIVLVLFFLSCPLSVVGWFLFAVPRIVICSSSLKKNIVMDNFSTI